MGQRKQKRANFLALHPRCFACGEKSVEIDHLPSRACFDDKQWPEEFEFPVCYSCNHATSSDEQFIAILSRMHSNPDAPIRPGEFEKYIKGAANNDPDIFGRLLTRFIQELPNQAKINEPDGTELVELGSGVREIFRRVLPKWARAFHYLETREILHPEQYIYGGHFTLPDILQGRGPTELFQVCQPRAVKRGSKDLGPQFGYGCAASEDRKLFAYLVVFRRAIGAWMVIHKDGKPHRDDPAAQYSLLPAVKSI